MTLRNRSALVSFAVATLFISARATHGAEPPSDSAAVLKTLHDANQMEIAVGKLAQDKGQSKDVKSFGKTLVTDHTAADKKVMKLAKDEKVDLAGPPPPHDDMDKLKAASGAAFDKAFAAAMLSGHEKVIADAKAAHDSTSDSKLKSLLASTLPVLEKHKQTAQKLVDQLGPSASAAPTNAPPVHAP